MEKSHITKWLLGPEVLWLGLYFIVKMVVKINASPPHRLDKFIENLYLWIPLAVLLTFLLWYFPAVEKQGLLLRVWGVGMIGGTIVLETGLKGYSEQGPGIGTAYILGVGIIFLVLIAGSIFVKIKF